MKTSRELFVNALIEAEYIENKFSPSEDEIQWEFSEKFQESMNILIKNGNLVLKPTMRTVKKSLLAAIIAILIVIIGLMSVSAIREPIIDFVKKVFPQYNKITLSENSIPTFNKIETEYTLTYLPEGFLLDIYQKNDCGVFSVWHNKNGEEVAFSQDILNFDTSIDTEHEYEELNINGYPAYLLSYKQNAILFWSDGNYCFTLNTPIEYKNEIITISENISKKN